MNYLRVTSTTDFLIVWRHLKMDSVQWPVSQVRGECTVPEYLLTYAQRDLNLTVCQVIVWRPLISFLLFDVEFYSEFILTAVCGSDVTLWQPRQGLICFMTFCHFMTFVDKQTGRNKNRDVNVYLEQGPWLALGGHTAKGWCLTKNVFQQ